MSTPDIRSAEGISNADLRDAMIAAFADYAIPMRPSQVVFDAMMQGRGLDRAASRVALVGGQIAAIWLVALREPRAYLMSSGTHPEHRGRGYARALAAASAKALKARGARHFQTEVLTNNAPALALYRSLGMRVSRELSCYTFPKRASATGVEIHETPFQDLPDLAFNDWPPSWQNNDTSLAAMGAEATRFTITENDQIIAHAALIPRTGTLAQIAVHPDHRRRGLGTALIGHAQRQSDSLRLINVQSDDAGFAAFARSVEAAPMLGQFELEVDWS